MTDHWPPPSSSRMASLHSAAHPSSNHSLPNYHAALSDLLPYHDEIRTELEKVLRSALPPEGRLALVQQLLARFDGKMVDIFLRMVARILDAYPVRTEMETQAGDGVVDAARAAAEELQKILFKLKAALRGNSSPIVGGVNSEELRQILTKLDTVLHGNPVGPGLVINSEELGQNLIKLGAILCANSIPPVVRSVDSASAAVMIVQPPNARDSTVPIIDHNNQQQVVLEEHENSRPESSKPADSNDEPSNRQSNVALVDVTTLVDGQMVDEAATDGGFNHEHARTIESSTPADSNDEASNRQSSSAALVDASGQTVTTLAEPVVPITESSTSTDSSQDSPVKEKFSVTEESESSVMDVVVDNSISESAVASNIESSSSAESDDNPDDYMATSSSTEIMNEDDADDAVSQQSEALDSVAACQIPDSAIPVLAEPVVPVSTVPIPTEKSAPKAVNHDVMLDETILKESNETEDFDVPNENVPEPIIDQPVIKTEPGRKLKVKSITITTSTEKEVITVEDSDDEEDGKKDEEKVMEKLEVSTVSAPVFESCENFDILFDDDFYNVPDQHASQSPHEATLNRLVSEADDEDEMESAAVSSIFGDTIPLEDDDNELSFTRGDDESHSLGGHFSYWSQNGANDHDYVSMDNMDVDDLGLNGGGDADGDGDETEIDDTDYDQSGPITDQEVILLEDDDEDEGAQPPNKKKRLNSGDAIPKGSLGDLFESVNKKVVIPIAFDCMVAECRREFPSLFALKAHRQMDHQIERYRCLVLDCGDVFARKIDLTAHQDATHPKPRIWACALARCDRTFGTEATSLSHYGMHHERGRFKCAQCKVVERTRNEIYYHAKKTHKLYHSSRASPVTSDRKGQGKGKGGTPRKSGGYWSAGSDFSGTTPPVKMKKKQQQEKNNKGGMTTAISMARALNLATSTLIPIKKKKDRTISASYSSIIIKDSSSGASGITTTITLASDAIFDSGTATSGSNSGTAPLAVANLSCDDDIMSCDAAAASEPASGTILDSAAPSDGDDAIMTSDDAFTDATLTTSATISDDLISSAATSGFSAGSLTFTAGNVFITAPGVPSPVLAPITAISAFATITTATISTSSGSSDSSSLLSSATLVSGSGTASTVNTTTTNSVQNRSKRSSSKRTATKVIYSSTPRRPTPASKNRIINRPRAPSSSSDETVVSVPAPKRQLRARNKVKTYYFGLDSSGSDTDAVRNRSGPSGLCEGNSGPAIHRIYCCTWTGCARGFKNRFEQKTLSHVMRVHLKNKRPRATEEDAQKFVQFAYGK